MQRQAQLLPVERGSLPIQLTNHGVTVVTVDLSALMDRQQHQTSGKMLAAQKVDLLGDDPERMQVVLTATITGEETVGVADDPWDDHQVRECTIPPGQTILASIPIPYGLVWPGERIHLVVALIGKAGTVTAPGFNMERASE